MCAQLILANIWRTHKLNAGHAGNLLSPACITHWVEPVAVHVVSAAAAAHCSFTVLMSSLYKVGTRLRVKYLLLAQ